MKFKQVEPGTTNPLGILSNEEWRQRPMADRKFTISEESLIVFEPVQNDVSTTRACLQHT